MEVLDTLVGRCDFNKKYRGLSFVDVSSLCSQLTLIISIPQIALISPTPNKFGVLPRLIAHDVVKWTPDQLELMFFARSPEVPSFKITSNVIELTRLTVLLCCLSAWI